MDATLIERLEKATGQDSALEADIYAALNPHLPRAQFGLAPIDQFYGDDGRSWHFAPRYTESLDAAMTLIPGGWTWAAGDLNEDNAAWSCLTSKTDWSDRGAEAATVPLALCIAALRARS